MQKGPVLQILRQMLEGFNDS